MLGKVIADPRHLYEHGKGLLLLRQYLLSNRLKPHSENCFKEIALTFKCFGVVMGVIALWHLAEL